MTKLDERIEMAALGKSIDVAGHSLLCCSCETNRDGAAELFRAGAKFALGLAVEECESVIKACEGNKPEEDGKARSSWEGAAHSARTLRARIKALMGEK